MELYAAGFNAWNQLHFDDSLTRHEEEPDDVSRFTCVLRDEVIHTPRALLSCTIGDSPSHSIHPPSTETLPTEAPPAQHNSDPPWNFYFADSEAVLPPQKVHCQAGVRSAGAIPKELAGLLTSGEDTYAPLAEASNGKVVGN